MRWLRLVSASGSTSLAKPGSMPLTCRLAPVRRPDSASCSSISGGRIFSGHCSRTGPLEVTLMPASMNPNRSWMHSKTRSSAIAVCTMQSGFSAISASRSVVARTPSSRPSSASSPASLPSLAGLDTHTPTSSSAGCASIPAIAWRPMVPVDQTTTFSGSPMRANLEHVLVGWEVCRRDHGAARPRVDRRHAPVAVDADALGGAAGGELADQVGLAEQGAAHGHEVEAVRHRLLHGVDPVDPAEQHQRHREGRPEAQGLLAEVRLLEGVGLEEALAHRRLHPEAYDEGHRRGELRQRRLASE